jgi:hypothetical protein
VVAGNRVSVPHRKREAGVQQDRTARHQKGKARERHTNKENEKKQQPLQLSYARDVSKPGSEEEHNSATKVVQA